MKSASRYWMLRAYVATRALVVVFNMLIDPSTLTRKAVETSGTIGWFAVSALGALALLALVDVFVNDLCPDRFVLNSFMKRRHLVYMALSVGLMSMSYIALKGGAMAAVSYFWVDACFACGVAIADLFARHQKDRRNSDRRFSTRRDHERRSLA